jgi:hypothetical protein
LSFKGEGTHPEGLLKEDYKKDDIDGDIEEGA